METYLHSDRVSLFLFGAPWHVTCNARVEKSPAAGDDLFYFHCSTRRAE
jgi:hypothetical protein